ncbi:hypothetical protein K431DRAFT_149989 [Polychaeton citri CBS 116435]|uniref:Uncharacterized protein n=1 Tax=Polychaeton citri CBS 116435 TaxID=1314669 RepID=A0A9P4Q0W3_9PEZI|nr:hypothetical protein K431DRAFT_149989 [Polychaeton citri CBS 116435]
MRDATRAVLSLNLSNAMAMSRSCVPSAWRHSPEPIPNVEVRLILRLNQAVALHLFHFCDLCRSPKYISHSRQKAKNMEDMTTCNRQDSHLVTHDTTDCPLCCLSSGEQTGPADPAWYDRTCPAASSSWVMYVWLRVMMLETAHTHAPLDFQAHEQRRRIEDFDADIIPEELRWREASMGSPATSQFLTSTWLPLTGNVETDETDSSGFSAIIFRCGEMKRLLRCSCCSSEGRVGRR